MHRRARHRRPLTAAALVVVVSAGVAGCGGSGGPAGPGGAGNGGTTATTAARSSYGSIAALHQALTDHGIACTLEYAGLRDSTGEKELSICTIDGEQAYLTIWLKPGLVDAFLASPDGATGTVAVGQDWTVVVSTPATAAKVAAALGGTAPTAPPATR